MKIDIIILSNGKTKELREMTQKTINSCHDSELNHDFNIIVFEQEDYQDWYSRAWTINYTCDFHYNKLMNAGIQLTDSEWIVLCNNDLIFHNGWLTECLKYDYLSMSPDMHPNGKGVKEGYQIGNKGEFKGWCIITNRKLYEEIGKIDESVNFHYSDHVFADQLKAKGIKHALIKGAYVEHLESMTLNTLSKEEHLKYCETQTEIYNNKPVELYEN